MKVHTEEIMTVVDRWFVNADPGDWVGVFENHDLSSNQVGTRIGFLYGIEDWDQAEIGRSHAPDSKMGLAGGSSWLPSARPEMKPERR